MWFWTDHGIGLVLPRCYIARVLDWCDRYCAVTALVLRLYCDGAALVLCCSYTGTSQSCSVHCYSYNAGVYREAAQAMLTQCVGIYGLFVAAFSRGRGCPFRGEHAVLALRLKQVLL